jgi:predicted unusual protein kinase regulating ubiquinone biosynthesis (AarF/ABC1/UbiB family)
VHHATKNGKEYAVKVQFPDIRTKAFADVNTIDSLVTVAAWVRIREYK